MKHVFKIKNGKYTTKFTDKFIKKHRQRCFCLKEYFNGETRCFIGHGDVDVAVANLKWGVLSRVGRSGLAQGLVLHLKYKKYILLDKFINHPTLKSIKGKV